MGRGEIDTPGSAYTDCRIWMFRCPPSTYLICFETYKNICNISTQKLKIMQVCLLSFVDLASLYNLANMSNYIHNSF